jgi:glycerol-3-phosphate cytidylyltransferase
MIPILPQNKGQEMRTIITYGTYDLFHIGHVKLLERARLLGDRLIVGVSTDEFNALKGKESVFPYEHRAQIVGALRCVDKVFPELNWDQKEEDIKHFEADIFVMGDDWQGKFDNLRQICDVHYLSRTPYISTTDVKQKVRNPL